MDGHTYQAIYTEKCGDVIVAPILIYVADEWQANNCKPTRSTLLSIWSLSTLVTAATAQMPVTYCDDNRD